MLFISELFILYHTFYCVSILFEKFLFQFSRRCVQTYMFDNHIIYYTIQLSICQP
nr:MAG TPA: hypothetical protein [Caudoviricetes sp.]